MFWKKWLKKRSSVEAKRRELRAVFCALLILAGTVAKGADKVKELQDHFDKEAHATSKVKALDKLAQAQFDAATKAGGLGDYVAVGLTFEKYRDNVRTTLQLLKKQEPDSDRHPTGYRQLELQVRKGLREVQETLIIAPGEMRPPLEIVRKDLLDLDDELIRLLFPRRTKDPQKVPAVPEEKP
jgi:hypothetical protein